MAAEQLPSPPAAAPARAPRLLGGQPGAPPPPGMPDFAAEQLARVEVSLGVLWLVWAWYRIGRADGTLRAPVVAVVAALVVPFLAAIEDHSTVLCWEVLTGTGTREAQPPNLLALHIHIPVVSRCVPPLCPPVPSTRPPSLLATPPPPPRWWCTCPRWWRCHVALSHARPASRPTGRTGRRRTRRCSWASAASSQASPDPGAGCTCSVPPTTRRRWVCT